MLFGDPPHGRGRQIESLVPADPLPARIGIALRPGTLQGMKQPVGAVDEFRRGTSLGTQRLTGRMRRIGLQRDEAALLDRRDGATTRDAEGTKRFDLSLFIHRRALAQFDAVEEPN